MKEGLLECKKGCYYENGIIIDKTNTGYTIEEITYEYDSIKISSSLLLNNDGKNLGGYVNYILGYIDIDEEYINDLFNRFIYNKENKKEWKWDLIE
jgi:hypothetical protein